MAELSTIHRVKTFLRIKHSALDEEIADQIEACKADLGIVGVHNAAERDPTIIEAIKLWCKAHVTDDPDESAKWMSAYNALKGTLKVAAGYGGTDAD